MCLLVRYRRYTHTTRPHSIEEGGHVDSGADRRADGPCGGAWRLLRLLKRAGQGVRRGAEYRWPHIRSGGEGGWTMVRVGLMRIWVSEAVKVRDK